MADAVPARIGKYQVTGRVGEGPLAEVLQVRLDGIAGFRRAFAIKRLRPEVAAHADALARIEAEARRAAALLHGNVVQTLDLGREDGRPHIVLEWVDGWSLASVLDAAREADRRLPIPHTAWIGLHVLQALEYAHREREGKPGQVHGALSADNVLLSRGGEVKVADFGLGRIADELRRDLPELFPDRADRLAPETAADEVPGPLTDVFAAGVLLYECLTLTHPFRDADGDTTRSALQARAWTPLATARPDAPPELVEVIEAALSEDPSQRPASATAMKDVVADVLRGDDVFTQERLEAWLADLLGTAPVAAAPASAVSQELDASELLLESPGQLPDPALPDADAGPSSDPEHTADVDLGEDDDQGPSTVVEEEDDARTAVSAMAAEEGGTASQWTAAGVGAVDPKLATRIAALRASTAADSAAASAPVVDLDAVRAEAARTRWRTAVLSALSLVLGAGAGWLVATQTTPIALTPAPAVLDVRPPPSDPPGQVLIDGKAVSGPRELPGGTHEVVVVQGTRRWEVELSLLPGEYRLVVVESAMLPTRGTDDAPPVADGSEASAP